MNISIPPIPEVDNQSFTAEEILETPGLYESDHYYGELFVTFGHSVGLRITPIYDEFKGFTGATYSCSFDASDFRHFYNGSIFRLSQKSVTISN